MSKQRLSRHQTRWESCTDCGLCETREQVVLWRGDPNPDIVFIGEAPGSTEDILGRPFVGRAGDLLNELIDRAQVPTPFRYAVTNGIACVPWNDPTTRTVRPPTRAEMKACAPRLAEFLRLTKPAGVVTLGKSAQAALSFQEHAPPTSAIYHPSYLLRQIGGTERQEKEGKKLFHRSLLKIRKMVEEVLK